jgi:hypothetical protein
VTKDGESQSKVRSDSEPQKPIKPTITVIPPYALSDAATSASFATQLTGMSVTFPKPSSDLSIKPYPYSGKSVQKVPKDG